MRNLREREGLHCISNLDGLPSGFHVMHSHDVRALEHRDGRRRHRSVQAIFDWSGIVVAAGEDAADERLSRRANQQGEVGEGGDDLSDLRDQLDLFLTLPKPIHGQAQSIQALRCDVRSW